MPSRLGIEIMTQYSFAGPLLFESPQQGKGHKGGPEPC